MPLQAAVVAVPAGMSFQTQPPTLGNRYLCSAIHHLGHAAVHLANKYAEVMLQGTP